ncbi:DUF1499 domain-containing protein [Methylosinus sp. H3A]|uniref:DUF1499 domain-containing protein n=1 Tax=Methylosinus sp. H3A TaxID=2785786 RepID=UPI0018C1F0DE|nr:DUF1499 domain-containing protein [Methylosinus sp. H3A]MBG0811660.1 DUF1499 domain-containing protein [Methylosinus sp. H3A]
MLRHIPEEPVSNAAVWCRRLAVFALPVAAIAVLLARANAVEPQASLAVLGGAILVALVALLLFLAACVVIWQEGRRGLGEALGGAFLAALTLGYPAYLAVQAVRLPVLSDISTDTSDPPRFSTSRAAAAARAGFTPGAFDSDSAERQREGYPDIEPIVVDLEPDEAFQLVLETAASRGWRVIDQRPPGGRSGVGHIDFLDRTLVMGFGDDITVRLRPLAGQTRIDVRSASRTGRHDFGANAKRIRQFAEELQAGLNEK